jgi:DNA helicase HerA-like ATPase
MDQGTEKDLRRGSRKVEVGMCQSVQTASELDDDDDDDDI